MAHATSRLAATLLLAAAGCSLFQELKSADSAEEEASAGESETGSSSGTDSSGSEDHCEVAKHDRCVDQDRLNSCDPDSGVLTEYDCGQLCGDNTNFTCLLATDDGRHACWCVVPGQRHLLACGGLEACLRDCANTVGTVCADRCFARADAGTIRLYGALVDCAHRSCGETCDAAPQECPSCIDSTIARGTGPCTIQRSLCNDDPGDETWPWE